MKVYNVSGEHGASGASGTSFDQSTASRDCDGRKGGHGTDGEPGTTAGTIAVRLTTATTTANIPKNVVLANPIVADVKLEYKIVTVGGQQRDNNIIEKFGPGELLTFLAVGGQGGDGGNGGNGQNGGNGKKGSDGTENKRGTDGRPGCDGGHGGNAGRGGDGGSGGKIEIIVPKADTHLLVLYGTSSYSGGRGGSAGNPGMKGTRGKGGKGGKEFEHKVLVGNKKISVTTPGGHEGRDGKDGFDGLEATQGQDGQDGKFSIIVPEGETNSTYEHIFNLNLLKFHLESEKQDGIIEPGCRVLVLSIEIRNVGGMPTPTMRSVLAYIKPDLNDYGGAMLNRPSWVVSEGYDRFVQLPPDLKPNVTTVVPCATSFNRNFDGRIVPPGINAEGQYLSFYIAPVDPVLAQSTLPDRHLRGEAFEVTSPLTIRAQMTPFGRDFSAFVNTMPFTITYPVKMSAVESLPSLPPGGNTLVRFSVSNKAHRAYGKESEIGRVVIIKATYTGGDMGASKMQFVYIDDGSPTSFVASNKLTPGGLQVVWPIPHLSAGETSKLSGKLSLLKDAEPYTRADFSVDLFLGEINNPTNAIRIQHRQISVCASVVYKKTPNSGTLLVTNQQTTKEELKAWRELAGFIFGDKNPAGVVDVWDISQEGHFDLHSVLDSKSTLTEEWKSCTIVVLDNPFDNFRTRTVNERKDDRALEYVNPDQLAEATAPDLKSNGMHFCIVSPLIEESAAQRQHLGAPQRGLDFTFSMGFETVCDLLNPFAIEPTSYMVYPNSKNFRVEEALVNDRVPGSKYQGTIHHWERDTHPNTDQPEAYTRVEKIILEKSLNKAEKLQEKLLKELLRKHPERRYTLSVCHGQDMAHVLQQARCHWQIPPKTQAAIRVRRLLDVSSLSSRITLTAAPASPVDKTALSPNAATIHTPEFIKSPQVTSAFVQSIPYEVRITLYFEALCTLDLLPSTNGEQLERANVLRASLLADLVCEQEALRLKKRNHGLTEARFERLLPRLSAFCHWGVDLPQAAMALKSAGKNHLSALLGDLKAYIMAYKSSWQRIFHVYYRSSRVTKVSDKLIHDFMGRIFPYEEKEKEEKPEEYGKVEQASSNTLKEWKKDLKSSKKSLSRGGKPVTLKGRAFAALLGNVACKENKWSDNSNDPFSIAGSVCTEFGMHWHSTPESFAARSGLGPITHNKDAMLVTNKSMKRKSTITDLSTSNTRGSTNLSGLTKVTSIVEENGVILPPYQLNDSLNLTPVGTSFGLDSKQTVESPSRESESRLVM